MSILPPEVRAGYVYDRVLRAIGDRPYDDDRLPDGIPAQGKVIFRPKNAVKQVVSEGRGVTVTREPVTCTIHQGAEEWNDPDPEKGGLLIDEAGAVGGVWLVIGEWTVEYHMEDRYSNIPNEEIIVTEEHTEDNPLDVALASEITPTPTQKFVVNEQIYIDSKNYRDEALEFRNEAQEAFEKFTWPVQVQDTPPENTDVIWVNPDEPAGTASDWALRAEAAAATLGDVGGLHVDTSVGTRVFVGDTMIHGDTGWRDVRDQMQNGWTADIFNIRRIDSTVYIQAGAVDNTDATSNIVLTLPSGFRTGSSNSQVMGIFQYSSIFTNTVLCGVRGGTGGSLFRIELGDESPSIGGQLTFNTPNTWPTSLPGTPA